MTVDPRIRVVIYGVAAGSQTWSHGVDMRLASTAAPTQAAMDTFAEACWADAKSQLYKASPGILPFMSTGVTALGVRAYWYPAGASRALVQGQSVGASATGTSASPHPFQVAIAVTHLTASIGRSYRGRAYLPCNAVTVDPLVLNFSGAQAGAISLAYANWLSAINIRPVGAATVVASVASGMTGFLNPITRVRCDNVADTIRARRDKILATVRSATTVVVP